MPYLNVEEVESALEAASLLYPDICSLVTLPNPSCEGRTTHAIRMRAGTRHDRHGVLLIGGVHAREWGSSDILVSLAEDLLRAYTSGVGLTYGGRTFSAADIVRVLENLDLVVFPDVNPDGKQYSQTVYSMWRKNRCPIPYPPGGLGTDLNRNYDFLWDYRTLFDPGAFLVTSDNPNADTFHGIAPFSEPEARNVKHLLDTYRQIRLLIDIHSYRELFLYPWGDDENQSVDPSMAFNNASWDGRRGVLSDQYREYVHAADLARWTAFCNRMNSSLRAVRGHYYRVGQGFTTLYPTCGTSHCYAFARHIVYDSKCKFDGLLKEWGLSFQPDYSTEMVEIIKEVSAALIEAALATRDIPQIRVAPLPLDFGLVRVGRPKTSSLDVRNVGTDAVNLQSVAVESSTDALRFVVGPPSPTSIDVATSATCQVTFAPDTPRSFAATVLLQVGRTSSPWSDVIRVPMSGSACALSRGACAAPTFVPMNWLELLALLLLSLIAVPILLMFAWIPGVACRLRQLRFRLDHWEKGNVDPCIAL